MKFIEVARKKFKLASRLTRLYALFIDVTCLSVAQIILVCFMRLIAELISPTMWNQPQGVLQWFVVGIFVFFTIALWTFGLLFIDGFRKGQGIGKKLLSLQVVRLKDGKPCTFKDAFIRRLAGIFRPLDALWTLGKKQQRMGDKFAETVVVKFEQEAEQTQVEVEDPEKVLENAIAEMTNRLLEAREKVDASISVEKQFQDAYEGALTQAKQWQERAIINLKAEREDLAREALGKRNEYQRLADQYKKQGEEQEQVVQALSNLLEHLQQKTMEAEGKKATVVAQHRNIEAEVHLREMLKEIQNNQAFETLANMEKKTTEAAALAKAAAAADSAYQNAALDREFSGYAEEASLDKELTELKAKL